MTLAAAGAGKGDDDRQRAPFQGLPQRVRETLVELVLHQQNPELGLIHESGQQRRGFGGVDGRQRVDPGEGEAFPNGWPAHDPQGVGHVATSS
jgi:hypothetical protein